ncbi:MAG: hypothetical protein R3B45_03635 [Bdellovibrionota bacterium]
MKQLIVSFFIVYFCGNFSEALAASKRLPILHHIGIIPTQWQQQNLYGLEKSQAHIDKAFPIAVRKSHRFSVLNDELVKDLWNSPSGREELEQDYELNAFINLLVMPSTDSVVLFARILERDLNGLLQESETLSRSWLQSASYADIEEKLSVLVDKLINRIPIDVVVTSIQGKYLTLSGGADKGIRVGDELRIVRAHVSNRHPATKFWMNFETDLRGSAKIIDTKKRTSVAILLNQTKEGAVEIGDGAKIDAIKSRMHFAKKESEHSLLVDSSDELIVVPPLYDSSGQAKHLPANNNLMDRTPQSKPQQKEIREPAKVELSNDGIPKKNLDAIEEKEESDGSFFDFKSPVGLADVSNVVNKMADHVVFQIGNYNWWYHGPRSTSSSFVWYLPVNVIGASVTNQFLPHMKYDLGGSLGMGQTDKSNNYYMYDSHAMFYWEDALPIPIPYVKNFQVGGHANFSGLTVKGQAFGGGDWIQLGIFGGLTGLVPSTLPADWYAKFGLTPITFGRLGYDESYKTIATSLGWEIASGAFLNRGKGNIEWGAGFRYLGLNIQDSDNKALGLSTFSLSGLARYRF